MKRLFSLTRALVARKRKIFALFFALAASIGMMNAKVTWNRCNISDLNVMGTDHSYSKEGVTLSANADHIFAMWQGYGDESHDGISFMTTDETGGFTFSNTLGKNFTKIEMFPNGPGIWDMANLGSGWSFSWDPSENKPVTVTWTGNASTVDLVKDVSDFHGENVKKIVFYFEGDSEEPDPTYTVALKDGTANADKVTLSATSVEECTTVTVTPNEECDITAFKATYNTTEELSTSFNTETGAYSFTMPAANVTIEATIALKPVPEGDIFAGFTATAGSGGFNNEGHANLVDNKFTSADWTKWCADNSYKSVPTGESGDACWWIDFEASAALNLTGYILTTGNDSGNEHGRNPKNWVLKAKLNAGDAWTTIATVTNDVTMKNQSFKDYKFYVDQSGSYKYFRFEVFANQGANVMQLCQLRLIGTDTPAAPANVCGDGLTWELNGGVLTISYDGVGTGEMTDFDYEYDQNPVNVAPWKENKSEITTVVIGDGVKSIGNYAFNDLYENFTAVTIANSVERIGLNAFMNAKWITEITLPSSLKTIDKECFAANFGFTSITIPSGVTSIGNKAFSYCNGLTSLTCEATTPPTLGSSVFYKITSKTSDMSNIPLYVPSESVDAYTAAAQWNAFDVQAIPGGGSTPANSCGDGLIWELSEGVLTISYTGTGTGVMDNYAKLSDAPWYSYKDDITSVTITDGVKSVGSYSFGYYGNLVTVTIGNDVETIGEYAFGDCYKFTTLNLGNSVKHIGNRAFMWAKVLTGFTLPSTLETIGERAFLQNKLITSLTIPSNVTSIGEAAFMYCAALTSVTVEATTPPTLGATVFDGVPTASIPLHVPSGSVAAYTAADQWKDFDIQDPTPAYEKVMNLINEIGTVELTAECKAKIDAARAAYDALNDGDKAQVTNLTTLTDAETTYAGLLAQAVKAVKDQIDALPATPLTDATKKLSEYNKVTAAREAYNALSDEEKAAVTNYSKLTAAEAAFAAISGGGGSAPAGALSGKFTINAGGDQIAFAKGNLQATTTDLGANWTWSFAANQWDYLGIAVANSKINGNGTVSENGTVDLFGWSTAATYYGINNSYKAVDYIGDFVDWGPNMGAGWRTLTKDEWNYLIENNTKGRATVNDKNGYIFLPNDWSGPAFTPDPDNFTTNVYSGDDWTAMENAGAVFLPSGPARNGTYALIANDAKYCSSTSLNNDTSYVFTIYYNQSQSACTGTNRAYGCMVRLVTAGAASPLADAQAAKDLIDAIPSPVVYTPECKEAIKAAREALDALSDEAKALFATADTAALPAAEATYAGLLAEKVAPVIAAINAIPSPIEDNLKLSVYDKVTDARALYDALTDEEKAAVTNYDKLTAAEEAFAAIPSVGSETVITWDKNTGIEKISGTATSPAYEGITISINGGGFSPEGDMLRFNIAGLGLSFEFANTLGGNFQKIVISSTNAMPATPLAGMGEGWAASNENKTATWTGDAATVKIWDGLTATSYWDVNTIQFTLGATVSATEAAQAAVDLINAIPDPVVLSDECKAKIDAAREAVTALGENASLIDDADIDKLAKAEADFALLIKDATAVVAKIDAIGDVTFSAECKEKIVDARNAYEALADELKPYVTNLTKLTDAEAAYEAARPFAPVTTVPAAVEALQYTGVAQTLITAGAVEHGTILYSLDGVDYSTELPTALLPGAYTVYYKVQATDDYKDVAPTTFIATIAYNYPATYGLFGIPEGWSVKVNDEEVAVVNGAVKNIAANDRFDIMPVKPEDVKLVEIVPYLLDLATATDSVIYLMNGDSITGTANGNISIVIVPDAKVYFKDVNLTNTGSHPAVLCGGNAEMVVVGENSITCTTEGEYGIRTAGAGTTLTISGDKAQLSATIDPNGGTVNQ